MAIWYISEYGDELSRLGAPGTAWVRWQEQKWKKTGFIAKSANASTSGM